MINTSMSDVLCHQTPVVTRLSTHSTHSTHYNKKNKEP